MFAKKVPKRIIIASIFVCHHDTICLYENLGVVYARGQHTDEEDIALFLAREEA